MEMTRDELNKMTKRDLIEHSSQYGVHPNRKDIPKGMLIDLIIHHGFNRPPPKRDESKTNEANEEYDDKNKEVEELICANACSKNCFEVNRYFECKHPCCIKTVHMCPWCIECGCSKRLDFEMMD